MELVRIKMTGGPGHGATEAVTNDNGRYEVRMPDAGRQLRGKGSGGVLRPMIAIAATAEINRNNIIILSERGSDEVPPVRVCCMAVNQQ